MVGLRPAAFGAEGKVEHEDENGALQEDADISDPEIDRRERLQAFAEVDHERAADRGDQAEQGDGTATIQAEAFFEEGDPRLEHRERGGDRGDEEQGEEQPAEEMSVGHAGEDLRQHVETQGEGAARDGRGTEEGEGGGDGDEAAEADFAELVGGGGGEAA